MKVWSSELPCRLLLAMILENQTLLLLITPGEVININQYQKSKLCLPVCWTKHINKIVTNNKFNLSYELCWADAGSRELTPRIGQSCEYHSFHNFRDKFAKKILWLFQEMSNTCLNLQRKSEDCFRKCLHVYIKCLTLNISRVHWCERGGQETVSGTPTRKVLAKFIYTCLYGEKKPWYAAKLICGKAGKAKLTDWSCSMPYGLALTQDSIVWTDWNRSSFLPDILVLKLGWFFWCQSKL